MMHVVRARSIVVACVAVGGFAVAACCAAVTGCGGATASPGGSDAAAGVSDGAADRTTDLDAPGGDDVGYGLDAGCGFSCPSDAGDAGVPPCPATPPGAGTPCSQQQVCEYGSSWWLECNTVLRCAPAGGTEHAWTVDSDGGQCPWLDAGAACPATWAEATGADAGMGKCPFVTCVYPEGFCGCGVACGGGGGFPHPEDVTGIFTCIPTQPGCPEPRPLSGTACDSGVFCSYGFACGCGQEQQCDDGTWQAMREPPCP
jgi:hypothetical protein